MVFASLSLHLSQSRLANLVQAASQTHNTQDWEVELSSNLCEKTEDLTQPQGVGTGSGATHDILRAWVCKSWLCQPSV